MMDRRLGHWHKELILDTLHSVALFTRLTYTWHTSNSFFFRLIQLGTYMGLTLHHANSLLHQ